MPNPIVVGLDSEREDRPPLVGDMDADLLVRGGTSPARVAAPAERRGVQAMSTADDSVRIVLADDHAVVRAGIRMVLDGIPGWEVVAECGDADTAARQVRGHHPDVLVLDLTMPGRPSLDALAEIRRRSPGTHVVILTVEADPAMARHAMVSGASGYVLKEAADTELVEAIRRAVAGTCYLDPSLGARVAAAPETPALHELSSRELEVLRLIALGNTNTEVADTLCLSVRTVETHRSHILTKTRCKTRAQLVAYALGAGLLDREFRAVEECPP
jgi:two-component system, NarL family, response regulator NreC